MESIISKIINDLNLVETEFYEFLGTHSSVRQTIFPGDGIISMSGNHSFNKLKKEAVSIQDKILKKYNKIFTIIDVLLSESSEEHLKKFKKEKQIILENLLQNKGTWSKSTDEIIKKCTVSIGEIRLLITSLFPGENDQPVLVVDTNALYENIEIEQWQFEDFNTFEIIITPSVLKDLDKHKIEHRNENVRVKAKKLINKIKEYRRRGKLTEGVTIVKDKIFLRTIAKEPDFNKTLKWLDASNEDDRLIAEFLEIIRSNGNRPVIMLTGDINLQNKCEVADLPFIEPLNQN